MKWIGSAAVLVAVLLLPCPVQKAMHESPKLQLRSCDRQSDSGQPLLLRDSTMSYRRSQFRDLIERTLRKHSLYSPAAVNLLLGTAAVESRFGSDLRQVRGPALGAFQMEPATYRWLQKKYKWRYAVLSRWSHERLEYDLEFAILLARLRYRAVPHPLPTASDVTGMARYWKRWYNTAQGRGTEAKFVRSYDRHVRSST